MTSFFPDKQKKLLPQRSKILDEINQLAEDFVNCIIWDIKYKSRLCVLYYHHQQKEYQSLTIIQERFAFTKSLVSRFLEDPCIRQTTKTALQKNVEILEQRVNFITAIDKKNRSASDSVTQSNLNETVQEVSQLKTNETGSTWEYLVDYNSNDLELLKVQIEKAKTKINECSEQIKMLEHDSTIDEYEKHWKIHSLNFTIKLESFCLKVDQAIFSAQKLIHEIHAGKIHNLDQLSTFQNSINFEIKPNEQRDSITAKVK